MYFQEWTAIFLYLLVLTGIGFFSYKKHISASAFIMGNRSMNVWLTALAAHASDMSSWLFMAYPGSVFTHGYLAIWTAIGLIVCMYANWKWIAPKIRVATEQYNAFTFSSFFESRYADTSGRIRIFSSLVLMLFYTIYIAAQLTTLGENLEVLFNTHYITGILLGVCIITPYVFAGGYLTLARIDLFQGLFLLGVILFVPFHLLPKVGGFAAIKESMNSYALPSLFPDYSPKSFLTILSLALGWGLGYFGPPHIVTKFMGIKKVKQIPTSKWIGMSWMTLSLGAATLVGLVALPFFQGKLPNPELAFIEIVKQTYPPFFIGLILCAILAVTLNAMSSQMLVLSSSFAEDFYKKLLRPKASSTELVLVSRLTILLSAALGFAIAAKRLGSIYTLVLYAWAGIGSAFGPLVILSLYSKRSNRYGAWCGIIVGGLVSGLWPIANHYFNIDIAPLLPGFLCSWISIVAVSYFTRHKVGKTLQ